MIVEHHFIGSKASVYMDFEYTFENGVFTITNGVYIGANLEKFRLSEPHSIEIEEGKFYNIIITEEGIDYFHEWTDGLQFIDLIAWGTREQMEAKVMSDVS